MGKYPQQGKRKVKYLLPALDLDRFFDDVSAGRHADNGGGIGCLTAPREEIDFGDALVVRWNICIPVQGWGLSGIGGGRGGAFLLVVSGCEYVRLIAITFGIDGRKALVIDLRDVLDLVDGMDQDHAVGPLHPID